MKTNDDSAIAANVAIKQDDMKANPLFARAYRLCMPFERVQVCVAEVKGSGVARDLTLTIWGAAVTKVLSDLEANPLTSTAIDHDRNLRRPQDY